LFTCHRRIVRGVEANGHHRIILPKRIPPPPSRRSLLRPHEGVLDNIEGLGNTKIGVRRGAAVLGVPHLPTDEGVVAAVGGFEAKPRPQLHQIVAPVERVALRAIETQHARNPKGWNQVVSESGMSQPWVPSSAVYFTSASPLVGQLVLLYMRPCSSFDQKRRSVAVFTPSTNVRRRVYTTRPLTHSGQYSE